MLMTLDSLIKRFGLKITGVLHVGAHLGEEALSYSEAGIETVWWVEGNPDIIPTLTRNVGQYGQRVIQALVDDIGGGARRTFHVTNYQSMSSSLFEFGTHRQVSPDTYFVEQKKLSTSTLDELVVQYGIEGCNFLNMDLQGAELLALRGATKLLEGIDYIFTEINVDELYLGCVRLPVLDEFLRERGFTRVATQMAGAQRTGPGWVGWGDGFFIKGGRGARS